MQIYISCISSKERQKYKSHLNKTKFGMYVMREYLLFYLTLFDLGHRTYAVSVTMLMLVCKMLRYKGYQS